MSRITVVRFLTETDYPPFNFTGPDGNPAGFNVDLARALWHLGRAGEATLLAQEVIDQNIDKELQDDATWLLSECAEDLGNIDDARNALRALLRRSTGHAQSELSCGPVTLDTRTGRVSVSGNPVKMTSHEYRLLAYLMHHSGRVVSRTELVEHLYDQDFDRDSNTIEVFVSNLRRKLEAGGEPRLLHTIRGAGYVLRA